MVLRGTWLAFYAEEVENDKKQVVWSIRGAQGITGPTVEEQSMDQVMRARLDLGAVDQVGFFFGGLEVMVP